MSKRGVDIVTITGGNIHSGTAVRDARVCVDTIIEYYTTSQLLQWVLLNEVKLKNH